METLLKKALLFQAELVSLASEKVQEVASNYVEKGTLHDADAKKFVAEVRDKLEAKEKEFTDTVEKLGQTVKDLGSNLNFAAKNDIEEKVEDLDTQISGLESKLEELKMKKEISDKTAPKKAKSTK